MISTRAAQAEIFQAYDFNPASDSSDSCSLGKESSEQSSDEPKTEETKFEEDND
jgi:hypothetical protein